ncbi:hypothetical protein B0H12DRAFT_1085460 [Mycena haematopus]|nr:hypothetical protein B0H12DRAFT_1085460 [Mycena haematopus]
MSRLKLSAFKPTLKASIFLLQDPRACWLISGCDPQGYQHLDAVTEMGRWDEGCVLLSYFVVRGAGRTLLST